VTVHAPFVPGLAIGHGHAYGGRTGCTVFLGPFRAAVEVRGLATGLAAADGVMAWLGEQGRGYDTGVVRVPIVPAAVIFDLHAHATRPDSETGVAACADAREGWPQEGRVGAGAGATVGKIAGPEASSPGGVGAFAMDAGRWRVGAVAVVNALGDVLDASGSIVAGARAADGGFLDTAALLRRGAGPAGEMKNVVAGTNTTLAVVATDAPFSRVDLGRMARTAANALARRISPVHTPFDGDVVFAVSTAPEAADVSAAEIMALGVAAQHTLEEAITRSVTEGHR
jgi:L-aminopeptidase/D-esterase-like protein